MVEVKTSPRFIRNAKLFYQAKLPAPIPCPNRSLDMGFYFCCGRFSTRPTLCISAIRELTYQCVLRSFAALATKPATTATPADTVVAANAYHNPS